MSRDRAGLAIHVIGDPVVDIIPNFLTAEAYAQLEEIAAETGKTVEELVADAMRLFIQSKAGSAAGAAD